MNSDENYGHNLLGDSYRDPAAIQSFELINALTGLELFGDDPYLRMQAVNVAIVDIFLMQLESQVLAKLHGEERTPVPEAAFLSAQSQMWIFAIYELLRTWRQRVRDVQKWSDAGILAEKIAMYEAPLDYRHFGREHRAAQLKRVAEDPTILTSIADNLRAIHIPFRRIEALRINMAKHENAKERDSVAFAPGYGRINRWCGSLDYELSSGKYILGTLSRRDIAEELRSILLIDKLPTQEELDSFDAFMRGPPRES